MRVSTLLASMANAAVHASFLERRARMRPWSHTPLLALLAFVFCFSLGIPDG